MAFIGVPLYTGWVLCQMAMSRLLMSLRTSQAFEMQAELICARHQQRGATLRAISPMVSVESHGAYALETVRSDAATSFMTRVECDNEGLYCSENDKPTLQYHPKSTSIHSISTEMMPEEERELHMRRRTRAGVYQGSRWWWLSLPRRQVEEDRITVDATLTEHWDPGDSGPGVKDSRLGRYDHWL